MLNFDLIRVRLSQYGAVWLASFLLVAVGAGIGGLLLRQDLTKMFDVLLTLAFVAIGLMMAAFLAVTLFGRQPAATKVVLLALGLVLLLPLLWAPVLGAIVCAFFGHVSIEYSSVYAGFRIMLGRWLFGVMSLFSSNPYVDAAFGFMQSVATVVGFTASVAQLWQVFGRRRVVEG